MFEKIKKAIKEKYSNESYFECSLRRKKMLVTSGMAASIMSGAAVVVTVFATKKLIDAAPDTNLKNGIAILGGTLAAYQTGVAVSSAIETKKRITECALLKRIVNDQNQTVIEVNNEQSDETNQQEAEDQN